MSKISHDKSIKKYAAKALLDLGNPIQNGELLRQKRKLVSFGRKTWCPCYAIIAKGCMYVYEKQTCSKPEYAFYISSFEHAKSCGTNTVDDESVCFSIRFEEVGQEELLFACDTPDTREKWVTSINEEIAKEKKFSTDSAYFSGGSIASYRSSLSTSFEKEEDRYIEIDEHLDTTTVRNSDKTKKAEQSSALNCTRTAIPPTSLPFDSIQPDSGFINVGIHSLSNIRKAEPVESSVENEVKMESLKLSAPVSTAGSDRYNDGHSIYENTEQLAPDEAPYSNVDVRKGVANTLPRASNDVKKKVKPSVAPKPTNRTNQLNDHQRATTLPRQAVSLKDDSAHLIVGDTPSLTRVKQVYNPCTAVEHTDTSLSKHQLRLDCAPNVPASPRSEDSNSNSGEESPIYENAYTLNVVKQFARDEYMCDKAVTKSSLTNTPPGTFFVRKGKETILELAIRTEDENVLFRIHEKEGRWYLSENQDFPSLDELIRFYSCNPLPSRRFSVKLERGYNSLKRGQNTLERGFNTLERGLNPP